MSWVIDVNENNRAIEITPENDEQEHFSGPFCECDPSIYHIDNGWTKLVHHSFDGREAVEWANEIISRG